MPWRGFLELLAEAAVELLLPSLLNHLVVGHHTFVPGRFKSVPERSKFVLQGHLAHKKLHPPRTLQ